MLEMPFCEITKLAFVGGPSVVVNFACFPGVKAVDTRQDISTLASNGCGLFDLPFPFLVELLNSPGALDFIRPTAEPCFCCSVDLKRL